VEQGAYVLWESGEPDLILIATGSEVALTLEAGRKIAAENGNGVRVVSMPCWEVFAEQPESYRSEVLPPEVKARLSVEAGVAQGWERWVGDQGDSLALDRFGASAPGGTVMEKLGYTVDNVVARATAVLERAKQHV
jgi:transketolase